MKLVADTLDKRVIPNKPERLIGDRAYDSNPLDESLQTQGIEIIAPHSTVLMIIAMLGTKEQKTDP